MKKILALIVLLFIVSSFGAFAEEDNTTTADTVESEDTTTVAAEESNVACTDSDGGVNPFREGVVSDNKAISGALKKDICFDRHTVVEYSCGRTDGEKIDCNSGCSEGKCITYGASGALTDACYDSDPADDPYNVGSIATARLNDVERDYCFDSVTLFEQNCEGGKKITCPQGCNAKGYCEQRGTVSKTQDACIDSDGGSNYFAQGRISYPSQPANEIKRDFCIEEDTLIEYTCEGAFAVECPGVGCAHGECIGNNVKLTGTPVTETEINARVEAANGDVDLGDDTEDAEEENGEDSADTTEETTNTNAGATSEETGKKSKIWLWVLVAAIVIAIIYFATGKEEKKKEE